MTLMKLLTASTPFILAITVVFCGACVDENGLQYHDFEDMEAVSLNPASVNPNIPAAPGNLQAIVIGFYQIDLTWNDNSDNEKTFKVYRKKASDGDWVLIARLMPDVTIYHNLNLRPGKTYSYKIVASNSYGKSISNIVTISIPSVLPINAPTNLSSTASSSTQINLTWVDASNNEESFKIERKTGSNGSYTQIASLDRNVSGYQDSGLVASTTYYYRIRAANFAGNSAYSNETNAKTRDLIENVRITFDATPSWSPSLVWTGSEYGISWEDRGGNYEIFFSRISATGVTIGSRLQVTSASALSSDPSMVWTGSEYGLVWVDARNDGLEIYFARVAADGIKVGGDIRITTDGASTWPALVWTGSEYGVSWYSGDYLGEEIYFARISAAGSIVGENLRVTSDANSSRAPSLAWTGSEFGVSWEDNRDGNYEIYFSRISSEGTKIGGDLRVTSNASDSGLPDLVWNGSEFGMSWHDKRDGNGEIYFSRITATGNKINDDIRITWDVNESAWPKIIWTGSEYGVSWEDNRRLGLPDIFFTRISSIGGRCCDDMPITLDFGYKYNISLTWTGSEYGAGWQDMRNGNTNNDYEIYFSRFTGVAP